MSLEGPPVIRRAVAPKAQAAAPPVKTAAKLADIVAERIQTDIAAIFWPAGHLLGNEAQLMAHYGVSRATLREAIRQLERHGVATMRRGFGGGLVVQHSAPAAAAQAMATYLELTDVTLDELFEARSILELRSVDLAIQRLSDEDIAVLNAQLRTLQNTPRSNPAQELECARAIRLTMAGASRNLALSLFLDGLHRVTGGFMPDAERLAAMPEQRRISRETVQRLAQAVISGNPLEAEQAVLARAAAVKAFAIDSLARFTRQARSKQALERGSAPQIADWNNSEKLPHRLAVAIARDVAHSGHAVGERLGCEADLVARYGVSRAIFREAIRLLESYGIVHMRRGHGGGLVVGRPSPDRTVAVVSSYLIHAQLGQAQQYFDVQAALDLAVAPLAAARANAEQIGALRARALALESRGRRDIVDGLVLNSLALKDCVANRAIALIGRIIHEVTAHYRPAVLPPLAQCRQLLTQHLALLDALSARDAAMARRMVLRTLSRPDPARP